MSLNGLIKSKKIYLSSINKKLNHSLLKIENECKNKTIVSTIIVQEKIIDANKFSILKIIIKSNNLRITFYNFF